MLSAIFSPISLIQLPEGHSTPPTDEEVAQAIINRVADDGGTADDRKVIQRTSKTRRTEIGDKSPEEYDLEKKMGIIREEVVKTQRKLISFIIKISASL